MDMILGGAFDPETCNAFLLAVVSCDTDSAALPVQKALADRLQRQVALKREEPTTTDSLPVALSPEVLIMPCVCDSDPMVLSSKHWQSSGA